MIATMPTNIATVHDLASERAGRSVGTVGLRIESTRYLTGHPMNAARKARFLEPALERLSGVA
jgi:hypothetical protein